MQKVQFRDLDETNLFTCNINPRNALLLDNDDVVVEEVIDGSGIRLKSNFDGRTRRLEWDSFPDTVTRYVTLRTELKTYKGLKKQINLHDIDIQSLSWKNILVTNVGQELLQGGQIRTVLFLEYHYTESI